MKRFLASLCLFLAVVFLFLHYFAEEFSWYWNFKWFDIPMHFLGGFVVGLLVLLVAHVFLHRNIWEEDRFLLAVVMIPLVLVGLVWEVFEVGVRLEDMRQGYTADTLLDLVMDIVGGYAAIIASKKVEKHLSSREARRNEENNG